jgi:NCS1 family nucleobase:cation symporter-1
MLLIGHAGARYGVPYAVLARASFGTIGARLPALARALVACGWYGIQTWIGGMALLTLLGILLGRDLRGRPSPSSTSVSASSSPSPPSGRSSSSSCARGW